MRITSATIRNCRLHGDLKVDFDPARTLIGGPNESGKSTLIEAIHRAFFLRAKGTTEQHRALVSTLHQGHPEVEVSFEADGDKYVLKKRFGPNGTTTLIPTNAAPLSGEQAETELARILKVEANLSGRAVASQWGHLWIWQRQAGDDPTAHATAQCDGLLQRLQQMGGAAALQSELDARVARQFAETKDAIYTQAGKPKAGSDLERAEEALARAQESLNVAIERVQKLDSAATQLETASSELTVAEASLQKLQDEQEQADFRARKLGELQQEEAKQSAAARETRDRCEALEAADRQIVNSRLAIAELEKSLAPKNAAVAEFENAKGEAKSKASSAEQAYRAAADAVRTGRLRHELAVAHDQLLERTELHTKLTEKAGKIAARQQDALAREQELAQLPKVEKAKLAKLQKQENERSTAHSALQAMAAGVELLASKLPVTLGGTPLAAGQKQILTEDAEMVIGSATRLRISPGGGTSLTEARQAVDNVEAKLREMLDALGLQSVQQAAETFARREDLSSRINALKAELQGMGAESIAEEVQNSQNEVASAKGNVDRLAKLVTDLQPPADKAAAQHLVRKCRDEMDQLEAKETEVKATHEQASEMLKTAEEKLTESKADTQKLDNKLLGLNAQLSLLVQTHGDDNVRSVALAEAHTMKEATDNLLKVASDAIAALQPDLLQGDINRIKRAIQEETNKKGEARTQIAVSQASLRSDGSENPQAALATAEARVRSATEHRDSVLCRAKAIALLSRLFGEEQRTLAEQFTRPLADRVSGYLECIFGVGARAQVELQNNQFTGLRLYRPDFGGAAFAFDTLSGGTKEQAAAAVRLAMAEVLADNHEGCLPVIFDDAFAYSDPERVNRLQRMLDLAATRGLQIIVLTCNSSDYIALGAKTMTLRPESFGRRPQNQMVAGEGAAGTADGYLAEPETLLAEEPMGSADVTDDLRNALLNALRAAGGSSGNQALRQELGWNESTYVRVKEDLVSSGRLAPGRGRGGSVSMTGL